MTISASSAEVYEYAMKAVFVVIQFLLTFNSEFKYIFCNPKMSPLYYSLCLKKGIYIYMYIEQMKQINMSEVI